MPKLSYYLKKREPISLEQAEDRHAQNKYQKLSVPLKCTWLCHAYQWGSTEPFHQLYRKGQLQPAPLPEDSIQRKVSLSSPYVLFSETFFRLLEQKSKSRITQIIHVLQEESEKHWEYLAS